MTCHQFPNPRFKRFAGHLADLQAETAQDSPNAQFHIQQPSEKLLARNQQPSDLLRSIRFGVHRLEPSHPQQLCKPTRILADNALSLLDSRGRTGPFPSRNSSKRVPSSVQKTVIGPWQAMRGWMVLRF
jgi:hypothetical protein